MTIEEGNNLIAKFMGIERKAEGRPYELPIEFQQILKVKTTQNILFNENFELLFLALGKISSIKDLWCIAQQFEGNSCYVSMYYKADLIGGEWKNAKFSCERQKPINKFKQALFEVISTFCGWYYNHPECQTDMEYELAYVERRPERDVIYMKPKEVICPKCGKIYCDKEE